MNDPLKSSGFDSRYEAWLQDVTKWANRHNISVASAISILFNDSPYNSEGGPDLITSNDLYWAESSEFYFKYHNAK
jgi:hypothetical protein